MSPETSASSRASYIPRAIADVVVDALASARVVALLGARQAGKSTLARRLATERLDARYITLDDEGVRSLAAKDPIGFISGQGRPMVIDEIQRVPELLQAIKMTVDLDSASGQFLITGSANLRRVPTVSDALPGRVDYLNLWPFAQSEIEGRASSFLENLFEGSAPQISGVQAGRTAYVDRLLAGGFPEGRLRSGASRSRFFTSYVESIVERDVAETSRVHDPSSLSTLLRLLAARSGSLARYEALSRDVGADGKTIKAHLDVLERLYLVRIRRPWHVNLGKRQVKAPKVYLSDTGLLAGLIGVDAERVKNDEGIAGALFETFVATELERLASWAVTPYNFWHLREGEREVDVIIEAPSGEVVGIEVKSGATIRTRDFAGLAHVRDRLGDRFRMGIVLNSGEQTVPVGDRLAAVPLAALWAGRS